MNGDIKYELGKDRVLLTIRFSRNPI